MHIRNRRHYVRRIPEEALGTASDVRISHGDYVMKVMQRSWVAVMEIMPIDQARLQSLEKTRLRSLKKDRLLSLEKARLLSLEKTRLLSFEKTRLLSLEKARLHPLGEYVITLYTNVTETPATRLFCIMLAEVRLCDRVEETLMDYVNRSYALLKQRLLADAKAATKVAGCCKGCHIGCCEGCHGGSGCCGGCHIGYWEGCHTANKAATLLAGCCGCCHIGREAVTFRLRILLEVRLRSLEKKNRAFVFDTVEIAQAFYPVRNQLSILGRPLALTLEGKDHRLLSLEKAMLHPLGEYVITLYTNGKLRTRVTVTLEGGAEGTSAPILKPYAKRNI
ncbi:hypothetical protein Tco_0429200 [Tanacetum coccineum]